MEVSEETRLVVSVFVEKLISKSLRLCKILVWAVFAGTALVCFAHQLKEELGIVVPFRLSSFHCLGLLCALCPQTIQLLHGLLVAQICNGATLLLDFLVARTQHSCVELELFRSLIEPCLENVHLLLLGAYQVVKPGNFDLELLDLVLFLRLRLHSGIFIIINDQSGKDTL